jgi:Helix-turn-helix domain
MQENDRWLTTDDVAERQRTSPGTIRYRRHAGTGPKGTLFGRRVLYRLSDVEKWEREREAADPTRRASA